jgi:putative PIN family toxin of toxin-antitoxin system
MTRAVVDTNILVSALLRPGSPPDAVLQAIAARTLTPVVCDAILAEYAAVLARPRFAFSAALVNELLHLLRQQADWVNLPPYDGHPPLPDRADWPFVGCALAAGCAVVTGNLKHFPPEIGVPVYSARAWVTLQIQA